MSTYDWSTGSRLKLRHLQLVAAIARCGNLGAAATNTHMTQPAASRLLAELETIVGQQIFDRTPRGLLPNLIGNLLIRRADTVLSTLRVAGEEMRAINAGLSGRVAIGVVSQPAVDLAAKLLVELLKTHPGISLTVEVAPSIPLVERILSGNLDFAIARCPTTVRQTGLKYKEIGRERLSLIVRNDHPLADRARLELAETENEYWVMEPPNTLLRNTVEAAFRRQEITPPTRVLNTSSIILVIAAVREGGVIGVVPTAVAEMLDLEDGFRSLDLDVPADHLSVEPYGLITNVEITKSPAALYVLGLIEAVIGSFS